MELKDKKEQRKARLQEKLINKWIPEMEKNPKNVCDEFKDICGRLEDRSKPMSQQERARAYKRVEELKEIMAKELRKEISHGEKKIGRLENEMLHAGTFQ